MEFIYPSAFWFLWALSLPVIIHMFQFRKHITVYFSSTRFLETATKESRSRAKIKQLLILLTRLLFLTALVFAFAQPFIPSGLNKETGNSGGIAIYIDNSFSMDAEGTHGVLLEEAKSRAIEIINASPAGTRYLLITNDFSPGHQRFMSRDQALEQISALHPSGIPRNFSEIQKRFRELASSESEELSLIVFSDLQTSAFDLRDIEKDTTNQYLFVPSVTENANNLYIDSCWFEYPFHRKGQQEELSVRIVNGGTESYSNIPVKLYINDSLRNTGSFSIKGKSSVVVLLKYVNRYPGMIRGKIEITDYPVTYDNSFYFTCDIPGKIRVLEIKEKDETGPLEALYMNDSSVSYTSNQFRKIDYSSFKSYHAIILNGLPEIPSGLQNEIVQWTSNGGSLAIIPSSGADMASCKSTFAQFGIQISGSDTTGISLDRINYSSSLFKGSFQSKSENPDLPVVRKYLILTMNQGTENEVLISARNGYPMVMRAGKGFGALYAFAFPWGEKYTSFASHPVFIPLMYNIAVQSATVSDLYTFSGSQQFFTVGGSLPPGDQVVSLRSSGTGLSLIPAQQKALNGIQISLKDQAPDAGFYEIIAGDSILGAMGLNYDRMESVQEYLSTDSLEGYFSDMGMNISILDEDNPASLGQRFMEQSNGTGLWKYFVLAALLFLLCETLIIRLWKI